MLVYNNLLFNIHGVNIKVTVIIIIIIIIIIITCPQFIRLI